MIRRMQLEAGEDGKMNEVAKEKDEGSAGRVEPRSRGEEQIQRGDDREEL